MSSRISSALAALVCLAACSVKSGDDQGVPTSGEAGEPVGIASGPKSVPCALSGAREFKQDCAIERYERDGLRYVVVRHPDGGFRRLIERDGGKGFATADGADAADTTPNGEEIEVTVDQDHYLFPAPVRINAPRS